MTYGLPTIWSKPGRCEELERMWSAGYSASRISAFFGDCSRNAVIGKLHRLGFTGDGRVYDRSKHKQTHNAARTLARQVARKSDERRDVRIPLAKLIDRLFLEPPRVVEIESKKIHLKDIADHQCRWPIGEPTEMIFCGNDKFEQSSYCAAHVRIAYYRRPAGQPR